MMMKWVISSMVLEDGVGVNNQNWALTWKSHSIGFKLELTFDC